MRGFSSQSERNLYRMRSAAFINVGHVLLIQIWNRDHGLRFSFSFRCLEEPEKLFFELDASTSLGSLFGRAIGRLLNPALEVCSRDRGVHKDGTGSKLLIRDPPTPPRTDPTRLDPTQKSSIR